MPLNRLEKPSRPEKRPLPLNTRKFLSENAGSSSDHPTVEPTNESCP